jgi:hypothetical protein
LPKPAAHCILAIRAAARFKIQLQVKVPASSPLGRVRRLLGHRGTAEIGVQKDAGGIDHFAQAGLQLRRKLLDRPLGQDAEFHLTIDARARQELPAQLGDHGACGGCDPILTIRKQGLSQGRRFQQIVDGRQ